MTEPVRFCAGCKNAGAASLAPSWHAAPEILLSGPSALELTITLFLTYRQIAVHDASRRSLLPDVVPRDSGFLGAEVKNFEPSLSNPDFNGLGGAEIRRGCPERVERGPSPRHIRGGGVEPVADLLGFAQIAEFGPSPPFTEC